MIHVIATMTVKAEHLDAFIKELQNIVDAVRAEDGCLEYEPAIDVATGIGTQLLGPNEVVIVEKWQTLADLHKHRAAPHLLDYKSRTSDMVDHMSIKVLQSL